MKARVLIVDDSATVRADLRGVLSAAGFDTILCENLAAARKALQEQIFNLVILDMLLPDGEGSDLLEELRRSSRTSHLPVMMLSTESAVRQRLDGLSRGANDYVGKPYDPAYVVKRACELTQMPEDDGVPRLVSAGRRRRVLVVDSHHDFANQAAEALRKDGHDVILTPTGEEALKMLDAQPVDCILVDLESQATGGLNMARDLRSITGMVKVPLVALAGRFNAKLMSEALSVGVDTFFSKTDSFEMLRVQVRTELRRRVEGETPAAGGGEHAAPAHTPHTPRHPSGTHAPVHSAREPAPAVPAAPKTAGGSAFFDEVVARSGLSPVIAPTTIARACRRAGVDPQMLNPVSLERALPSIRHTLAIFLDEKEVEKCMVAFNTLIRQSRSA
jgi:DNA-binding response OmpR family regulator